MAYTTINDPSLYFRAKSYTGNGANNRAVVWDETHANMQPDWLWFKSTVGNQSHALFDSVRGAVKRLISNSNGGQGDEATNLDSFDTNGFTVDNEAIVNHDSNRMMVWGWKGGTTSGIGGSPSITPSGYSFNATAGFSIIGYTGNGTDGATISHGLGTTVDYAFFKRTDGSANWVLQAPLLGNNVQLVLNDRSQENTDTRLGDADDWNSTLVELGTYGDMNGNNDTYIMYAFSNRQGYQRAGNYVGNGNADGPFVYTGFKPAFVLRKRRADSDSHWFLNDNKREGFNGSGSNDAQLVNTNSADTDDNRIDFLSNGFKVRTTDGDVNANGGNYIYLAIAESPLVNSEGIPNNAR